LADGSDRRQLETVNGVTAETAIVGGETQPYDA